jgi:predicted AlkP superfamily pyrophosphatase or phosphodiesterase
MWLRIAAVLLLLVWGPAWAGEPLVILLSWDGMRHDFPDRAAFPGLARLQHDGLRAERLVPGWPSTTFPGHVTLATGAWAEVHGVVDNEFLDRQRGRYAYSNDASWLDAEPLWITAERQGVHAATFFWVGSETDWHGQHQRYRRAPFDGAVPESDKVDQILAWIDLPVDQRPGLIMAYWHGADSIAHQRGPDHPAVVEQIAEQDRQLVRLLAGIDARQLWSDTTVIVVSDHGMTTLRDFFDVGGFLTEHGIHARVFGGPGVAQIFIDDPTQIDSAFAALGTLDQFDVYRGTDLPATFHLRHPTRTGDLIVLSQPPLAIANPSWSARITYAVMGPLAGWAPGSHGFDPALSDMGAILLAAGRGIPNGARIGAVPMIDIAPTVTRLLGIEPPQQSIGTALPAVLTP